MNVVAVGRHTIARRTSIPRRSATPKFPFKVRNRKFDERLILFQIFLPTRTSVQKRKLIDRGISSAMTNDAVCILLCRQRSGQLDARASRAKPLRATRPESTLHGVGGTEIDNGAEVPDGREWYTFKRGETITSLLEQSGLDRVTLQKLNPHVQLI